MTISNKRLHWFCALVTALILTGCAASRPYPYQGQVNQKGQAHGQGTMTYSDGSKYTGGWVDGKRHGRGHITFANGIIYEGQFSNDSVNGRGKSTTPEGKIYEGEWVDFKTTGLGKTLFPSGATYVGSYLDNKFHGHGTFTFPNGDKYVGEWRENSREGEGILTFADGRAPVEGLWKNGQLIGPRRSTQQPLSPDDRTGWIEIFKSSANQYSECTGAQTGWTDCFSVLRTPIGTYTGTFKDGAYNGLGVLAYPLKAESVMWEHFYIGEFSSGGRTGEGVYLEIVELGITQRSGIWKNGELLQSTPVEEFTNPELRDLVDNLVKKLTPKLEASLSQLKKAREEQESRRKEEERERLKEERERLKKQKERERLEERLERERVQRKFQESYGPALEKCELLGFKKGTDKFADCVLRLSR